MRPLLAFAAFLLTAHAAFAGERAKSPSEATVFIRLVGSVHADITELGRRSSLDRDRVEIGTGSGFLISPDGHVLTNDHVVSNSQITLADDYRKVVLTLKVSKIEVCLPSEIVAARGGAAACSEATVFATDPDLDLAVLFVNGSNQSYLAMGDSDVVTAGQPVQALGFPFGRKLDIGRDSLSSIAPEITTTAGSISSLRAGDSGERRFLQIDANLNPGNSGGPLINREGFVVGIIHSKLKEGTGIGFAIPINQAKSFLESRGLDQAMPTRRLRLGPVQRFDAKGIAVRMPEGLSDVSPLRTRIETEGNPPDFAMRLDRVVTPWTLNRVEQELVGTRAFERAGMTRNESRTSRAERATVLTGQAVGTIGTGTDIGMAYSVLDLGREKIVARFVGPIEQLAFNEGVLRDSLASLDAERLLIGALEPVERIEWSSGSAAEGQRPIPVPVGWIAEPGAPTPCARLPKAGAAGTAVPVRDFTVALRVAIWSGTSVDQDAASACWPQRNALGQTSYASRADWLGVSYAVEGVLVRVGPRLLQLEVLAPDQKSAYARALLAAWVKKATE